MIELRWLLTPINKVLQYRYKEGDGEKGTEYWSEWIDATIVLEGLGATDEAHPDYYCSSRDSSNS